MRFKVLILGGTTEGRLLGERLVDDARFLGLVSYAGRTERLQAPRAPYRVGGFGGVEGLARYLREEAIAAVIDATHPFAARISANAVSAAAQAEVPLLRIMRPAWQRAAGDVWHEVESMEAAVRALGTAPRRVFLAIGRQEVAPFGAAPQHDYLVRAIDAFEHGLPRARLLLARGPFDLAAERELLRNERIEVLVSKNAGTQATYAKLQAARELAMPVVMVGRPALPGAPETASVDGAVAWLNALHGASLKRRGA